MPHASAPLSLKLYARRDMRLFLTLSILVLCSCVAIPRGSYYYPTHPLGEAKSGTCDKNSNKITLEIPLEKGIRIGSSLRSNIDGTSTLSVHILLPEKTRIVLTSNNIIFQSKNAAPETYAIKEWKDKTLIGEKIIHIYRGTEFVYDKSFGTELLMSKLNSNDYNLTLPEMIIDGSKVKLDPIVFRLRTGEVQWLPKLNC